MGSWQKLDSMVGGGAQDQWKKNIEVTTSFIVLESTRLSQGNTKATNKKDITNLIAENFAQASSSKKLLKSI